MGNLVQEWFPQLSDMRLRQVTWPEIAVHRDFIVGQMQAGVSQATIRQRLRDEKGLQVSVATAPVYGRRTCPRRSAGRR